MNRSESPRGGTRLGSYELGELLGKGGMGEVYLAQDTRLGRRVAIKILPPDATRNVESVRRFEHEAKAASARNHPNILTIYDFGIVDGTCYIAMEYVEGRTLRGWITSPPTLSVPEALEIAAQCADGLAAAHAAGIIHRDIKPANIMVRPDGYVKILDFGLAKLAEPTGGPTTQTDLTALTAVGQIMGTTQYMSPEQARGQALDARTDIWSLGAVLYEMVSGKSPFAAPTMSDTMASVLTREPASLHSAGLAAGDALDRILRKALAKQRSDRYQSMADLAVDLRRLRRELELGSTTQPVAPLRVGRRRPWLPTLSLAGLLLVTLAVWQVFARRPVPPSPPERRLVYSLLVQKMRDGKPYQGPFRATGREIFENGWKVQFDFLPSQPGSLYLLNEGPGSEGRQEWSLVFPTPSVNQGSAQVTADTPLESAWLLLDNHAGREKFWLVWATHPVPDLEQARSLMFAAQQARQDNPQIMRDPEWTRSVQALLANLPHATAKADPVRQQTTLLAQGDVLISEFELEHD